MRSEIAFHGSDLLFQSKIEASINKSVLTDDEKKILFEYSNELTSVSIPKKLNLIQHICSIANKFSFVNWKTFTDSQYQKVQGNIKQCSLSESYKQDLSTSFKRFCKYLLSRDISQMTSESINAVKTHKSRVIPRDESAVLSDEQIDKIIAAESNFKYKVFFTILAESGCRPAEIAALKVSDVQLYQEPDKEPRYVLKIKAYKGGVQYRYVPLYKSVEILKIYLENILKGEYVFPSQKGGAISYQTVANRFNILLYIAGIEGHYTLYMLRHSRITKAFAKGVPEETGKRVFWGNADSSMAKRYIHMSKKDLIDGMEGF